uniref:Uncharacterized protein n=1 Tax=Calidris pygmaea TaxID=425635 RepID=A0A8C3J1N1_9CHAR
MAATDPPGTGDLSQLVSAGRRGLGGGTGGGERVWGAPSGPPVGPGGEGREEERRGPGPAAASRGSRFFSAFPISPPLPSPPQAENLLHQLQENFQALAEKMTLRNILFRLEMGERIDDLEKHVADLMTEAGIENTEEELRVKKLNYEVLLHFTYFHLVLNRGRPLA